MTDPVRFGCLIGLLLFSTVGLRWVHHGQPVPPRSDFATFPTQVAGWSGRDLPGLDANVKRVLNADSYVFRDYRNDSKGADVALFIAYYNSQRSGDALHSPKNCLPGAGWEPISSETIRVPDIHETSKSFEANHYVIEKDGVQQDVLYWYQAHGRTFASEYLGKFYLAWDGMTTGRTDGALIRLTAVRVSENPKSFQEMEAFAQALTPVLPQFLPN
jgi:EpsI family protein